MESSHESLEVSTENPVHSSAIEPLLNLALGASEEVNTTSNRKENTGKSFYSLRSKTANTNDKTSKETTDGYPRSSPLNSPIVSCSTALPTQNSNAAEEPQNVNDLVRVVSANEVDINNPVFSGENLHLVRMQETSSLTSETVENAETNPIPGGFVVIEQSVLEQISGFLKNAVAMQSNNVSKSENQVTTTSSVGTSMPEQPDELPNSTTNCTPQNDGKAAADTSNQPIIPSDEDEWIDTKATALQLTDELRRYHIPQAVFAKKILNRSQGTLSDILRKPKPWNEMKLGKEIFRKMKDWLSLPEVKRIPQLRTEAAKELDSRHKRHLEDTYDDGNSAPKKARRQFTESQKRALFAIFKETKKPTKDMQRALADELGLDLTTVSNFFMNARRRHTQE